MPINDPIKGKKVAPASLAFDAKYRGGGGQSASYQANNITQEIITNVINLTDHNFVRNRDEKVNINIIHAEQRAKQFVGVYSESFEWDYAQDVVVTTDTADPLGFDNEVIRCPGAYMIGTASTSNAKFEYHCAKGMQGVWLFYCHVQFVLLTAMGVLTARISIYKNDVQWRVLDALDANMSGDDPLHVQDCVLGGECQVPVDVGDKVDFRIYLHTGGVAGDQTLGFPTSAYGYAGGCRLRCDTGQINDTNTGDTYTFVT